MNKLLRKAARAMGYDLVPRSHGKTRQPPPDISDADRAVLERIAPYTMTSIDRQISLIQAVRHIVRQNIAGCFAECGVWRGGSSMAMTLALAQEGDTTSSTASCTTPRSSPSPAKATASAVRPPPTPMVRTPPKPVRSSKPRIAKLPPGEV